MAANIAKTEALVREAAGQGAQVILPSELFQGIYFPTRQDPKWFATAYPVREHPAVRALAALAKTLKVVIPISFFEKDGPRYLQQRGDRRCRRRNPRRLSQEPHPRRAGLSGEILLPPRRYRLQGLEDAGRHDRRRHLLGPMVPGSRARHAARRRRDPALSHGHRLGALRPQPRHARAMAARDAGPCGGQRRAGRGRQPHRHRGQ